MLCGCATVRCCSLLNNAAAAATTDVNSNPKSVKCANVGAIYEPTAQFVILVVGSSTVRTRHYTIHVRDVHCFVLFVAVLYHDMPQHVTAVPTTCHEMPQHMSRKPTTVARICRGTTATARPTANAMERNTVRHGKPHAPWQEARQAMTILTAYHGNTHGNNNDKTYDKPRGLAQGNTLRIPQRNPREVQEHVPWQYPRLTPRQRLMGTGCQVNLRRLQRRADFISARCEWEHGLDVGCHDEYHGKFIGHNRGRFRGRW